MIDPISGMSVKLQLSCNNVAIGPATGFIYQKHENHFLVSNWHVFSGRSTYTGQPISKLGAIPDRIEFEFYSIHEHGLARSLRCQLDLQGNNCANWIQHPVSGQDVDIAAIRLPLLPAGQKFCAVSQQLLESPLEVAVGSDVYIVGFPLGISKQQNLPIWKRGSVASEFSLPFDGHPLFVVDTATREGMSGSPVFARAFGGYLSTDGNYSITTGVIDRFIGVYSGRYGADDEFSAQLGRVWRASLVDEIVEANSPGDYVLR